MQINQVSELLRHPVIIPMHIAIKELDAKLGRTL